VDFDEGGWLMVFDQVILEWSPWMIAMSIAPRSAAITNRTAARPTTEPRLVRRVRRAQRASSRAFDSIARVAGAREVDL
jgi:hypothetical protein